MLILGTCPGLAGKLVIVPRLLFLGRGDHYISRPESRQDYPPNLSILISGGKENNYDGISNGE